MAPKRNNNKKQEKRNSIKKTKRVIRPVEDLYDSEASNSSSFCEIIAIKRTSRDNSTDSIQYIKTIEGETVVPRANCAYNDEVEVLEVPKVSNKRKNFDSEDLTVSKHFKYAEFFDEFREYESEPGEETELVESSEIKESEEKEELVQSTEIKEREKEAEEEMVELPEIKEREVEAAEEEEEEEEELVELPEIKEREKEAEEEMVEAVELPKLNEFMSSIVSRIEEMTGEIEERNPKVVKFQLVFSDFPVFADDTEEMIFPA